jgi:hypothetical protein
MAWFGVEIWASTRYGVVVLFSKTYYVYCDPYIPSSCIDMCNARNTGTGYYGYASSFCAAGDRLVPVLQSWWMNQSASAKG